MPANAGAIRAGRAYVEFFGDQTRLQRTMRLAQANLRNFGRSASAIGRTFLTAGAALTAPLVASTAIFLRVGDRLDKLSQRTGVSVEGLSSLGFAAERTGSSMNDLETGLRRAAANIVDAAGGTGDAKDAFEALGIVMERLITLTPEQQFIEIADAISKVEDPTRRAAYAQDIFGRAGTRLLPLIQQGAGAIRALQQEAEDLGVVISTETATAAAELTDRLGDLRSAGKALASVIGAALAPGLIETAGTTQRLVAQSAKFIQENPALVQAYALTAAGVTGLGAALLVTGGAAIFASVSIGVVTGALTALLTPAGLALGATAALGTVLVTNDSWRRDLAEYGDRLKNVDDIAGEVATGVRDALALGDTDAAKKIIALSLVGGVESAIADIKTSWIELISFMSRSIRETGFDIESALAPVTAFSINEIIGPAAAEAGRLLTQGPLSRFPALAGIGGGLRGAGLAAQLSPTTADDVRAAIERRRVEADEREAQRLRERYAELGAESKSLAAALKLAREQALRLARERQSAKNAQAVVDEFGTLDREAQLQRLAQLYAFPGIGSIIANKAAQLLKKTPELPPLEEIKSSVRGTFEATAARGFGDTLQRSIADNTRRIMESVQQIDRNIQNADGPIYEA